MQMSISVNLLMLTLEYGTATQSEKERNRNCECVSLCSGLLVVRVYLGLFQNEEGTRLNILNQRAYIMSMFNTNSIPDIVLHIENENTETEFERRT